LHLPALRKALEAEVAKITVTPPEYDQEVALEPRGPSPKFYGSRDILPARDGTFCAWLGRCSRRSPGRFAMLRSVKLASVGQPPRDLTGRARWARSHQALPGAREMGGSAVEPDAHARH
jgi:hypothetical protein